MSLNPTGWSHNPHNPEIGWISSSNWMIGSDGLRFKTIYCLLKLSRNVETEM